MKAFAEANLRVWLDEQMLAHFADRYERLDSRARVSLIDEGLRRGTANGLTADKDICLFTSLLLLLGGDFESEPWAAAILKDPAWQSPGEKMEALYSTAMRRLKARGGAAASAPAAGQS